MERDELVQHIATLPALPDAVPLRVTYYRPKSAEGAVKLLDARWGSAELLAGGTDLLSLQKENIAQPLKVISLSDLPAGF